MDGRSNGHGNDERPEPGLTTRQGRPVEDNQDLQTVGGRGPAPMENYQFIEKIAHFARERIPERVVHARGAGAHGYFEAYGRAGGEPVASYTRASLFQLAGQRTAVFVRLSTITHGGHSPETLRDPRGFATKFYTEDGNWDLVGNNLPVFFIRDAMKFPDVIHAFKPDPVTFRQNPERIFDFISLTPEAMHMIIWLFSPRGIPADYRHQDGFGVNTFKWINRAGDAVLVKYHWKTQQGIKSLTQRQAEEIQATNFNHASQDLYDAIERGDHPEWELCVQLMTDGEHSELDFDPLDDTKTWPEDRFPLLPVGRMVLNRNPENYFAEVEQAAFGVGVLVDGLAFSDDKMLQGRTSSLGGLREQPHAGQPHQPHVEGPVVSQKIDRTNPYRQAGERYRSIEQWERDDLVLNLVTALKSCRPEIQERMISHLTECDSGCGTGVAMGLGVKALAVA